MRTVILAFNFLSVIYAIIAALGFIVMIPGSSVLLEDIDFSPFASLYVLLPLLYNIATVYGLKTFKTWAYLLAAIQLLVLISNLIYQWASGDWQDFIGSILLVSIVVGLGNILYFDFKSRPIVSA